VWRRIARCAGEPFDHRGDRPRATVEAGAEVTA
jgi:hypothetical protein